MKRRSALQSLALIVGGTITLPVWANNWSSETLLFPAKSLFSETQDKFLAELVETIIPTTNTPGAKALGVHQFIQKMLTDCYDKPEQQRFLNGLDELDNLVKSSYGKSFTLLDSAQRLEILKDRENAAKLAPTEKYPFFPYLKNLTIQGYLNSEYVMKDIFKYELVPSRYHGCVPVTASVKR